MDPKGYPGFDIRPPGRRDEYWVVEYIEPMQGFEERDGTRRSRAPVVREAAERARDTGEVSATGRYRLAQKRA